MEQCSLSVFGCHVWVPESKTKTQFDLIDENLYQQMRITLWLLFCIDRTGQPTTQWCEENTNNRHRF